MANPRKVLTRKENYNQAFFMNIDEKFLKFKWISFHNFWKGKYNHDDSVGWALGIIPHIPCRWLSSQPWVAYTHTHTDTHTSHEDLRVLSADFWSSLQVSVLHIQAALVAFSSQQLLGPPGCPVLTAYSLQVVTELSWIVLSLPGFSVLCSLSSSVWKP